MLSAAAAHAPRAAPPLLLALRRASSASAGPPPPEYVALSGVQRAAVALGSAVGALADPSRADLVAALGETTGLAALRRLRDFMRAHPVGRALLAERPTFGGAQQAACAALPPGSLGAEYAAFMATRGFRAADRPAVRFVADGEVAWVAQRARECHDLWHVLFACHTDGAGELALKAVEAAALGLPSAWAAALGAAARLRPAARARYLTTALPWGLRAGAAAGPELLCVRYEDELARPVGEVRARLGVRAWPGGRA